MGQLARGSYWSALSLSYLYCSSSGSAVSGMGAEEMELSPNWARTIAEQIIMELHLLVEVLPMQITSKGQVTIPQEIRNRLGLLPHTKVEFELAGDHARIRKARRPPDESVRGRLALEVLRGTADTRMRTDEILALTRGETRATTRRK